MLIHIGADRLVRSEKIIGVFDMDGRWDSPTTREFLKSAEKKGRTSAAGEDLPRSFVLTDEGVIFTHISASALAGRAQEDGKIITEDDTGS